VLQEWFRFITRLSRHMSRRVFYSSRSFTGRSELLEAALSARDLPSEIDSALKAGIKKAVGYNSFRNTIAHGQTVLIVQHPPGQPDKSLLVQGKHDHDAALDAAVTIEHLIAAANNFAVLRRLLDDTLFHAQGRGEEATTPLAECRALIDALPNLAGSEKPSQKQLGRKRQRLTSRQ
jgi:hypothetical protein